MTGRDKAKEFTSEAKWGVVTGRNCYVTVTGRDKAKKVWAEASDGPKITENFSAQF